MSHTIPNLAAMLDHVRSSAIVMDDFVGACPSPTSSPFSALVNGAGSDVSLPGLIGDNSPGVVALTTGTADTGSAQLLGGHKAADSSSNGSIVRFAAGIRGVFEARVRLPVLGPVGMDDELRVRVGFGSGTLVYARFLSHPDTSLNWIVENDDTGGSPTTTTTGVAVSTGWTKLKVMQNGTSSITYFINDVQVASHATNIPASGAPVVGLFKSGTGGSSYDLYVDYIAMAVYGLNR